MQTSPGTVSISKLEQTLRVVLTGEIDSHAVDAVTFAELESVGTVSEVVVDMTDTTVLDSQGVALLLQLRQLGPAASAVALVGANRRVHNVLRVCGVEKVFTFVDAPTNPTP
ncbi:STAS domain-containing protein [uncultured Jatrophihabitans sp.]|uniref:STAS domain-containing protein n=1 Tax=uncultured Jatrophihabitans sp. TaxID=1610747 RepID=UPI0035CA8897